jgi:hypothetical protein
MENELVDPMYQTMTYLNTFLATVVMILMSVVAWYFREDVKGQKVIITQHAGLITELQKASVETNRRIELMLSEMKSNREHDKEHAHITRQLLIFMAKKNRIQLPEL